MSATKSFHLPDASVVQEKAISPSWPSIFTSVHRAYKDKKSSLKGIMGDSSFLVFESAILKQTVNVRLVCSYTKPGCVWIVVIADALEVT